MSLLDDLKKEAESVKAKQQEKLKQIEDLQIAMQELIQRAQKYHRWAQTFGKIGKRWLYAAVAASAFLAYSRCV